MLDDIMNDLEEIRDNSKQARLVYDLLVKLDTARMELEANSPCMSYTCVCLESPKEANLLLSVLKNYAEDGILFWRAQL